MKARAAAIALLVVVACMLAWGSGLLAPARIEPRSAGMPGDAVAVVVAGSDAPPDGVTAALSAMERTESTAPTTTRRTRVATVGADGEPIAGAEVLFSPPRSGEEREHDGALHDEAADAEALLRVVGSIAITDAHGIAEIEADPECRVCARAGDLYGQGWMRSAADPFGDELRIELHRDVTLRLEVVDAEGEPVAGTKVEFEGQYVSRRRGLDGNVEQLGPTDADGVIEVPHLLLRSGYAGAMDGRIRVWCAREIYGNVNVLAEAVLSLAQLQAVTTVRLVVPVGGSIAVAATDADGTKLVPFCHLADDAGEGFAQPSGRKEGWLFEHVPLNRRWRLHLRLDGVEHSVAVDGPRTRGEVTEVAVRMPVRRVELVAKVVRRDGEPIDGAKVTCRCAALPSGELTQLTRGDGTFRSHAVHVSTAIEALGAMTVTIESPRCIPRTLAVDRAILPGTTDLGTLVVEPPIGETLLATVELRCEGRLVRHGWAQLSYAVQGRRPVLATERGNAEVIHLRGVDPGQPMLLSCSGIDLAVVRNVPVRVGAHVVVDLQRAARLRVAVLAPDVPQGELDAELSCDGRGARTSDGLDVDEQAFLFDSLEPGRYRLLLRLGDRVLHEEPAIDLRAGANRWPADGSRLDLRSRTRPICIVVRSAVPPGDYAHEWQALPIPAGATALPADEEGRFDRPWFLPHEQPTDLLVRAPYHVPVRVADPRSDVLLRLQPATQVNVEVDRGDGVGHVVTRMRIVDDAVQDPLLRAFDRDNEHAPEQEMEGSYDAWFVPGTIVELTLMRDGKPGAPQRVVIGHTSPQRVTVR